MWPAAAAGGGAPCNVRPAHLGVRLCISGQNQKYESEQKSRKRKQLSGPLDTKFFEGLDIPDTANTFVQGEIKTLSMDDWMKTSN